MPFGYSDPFAGAFNSDPFADAFSGQGGGRRRPAAYPPLPDEAADTAIQSLTGRALSGLGYVGSELDKLFGGRAVRGGLAGKPRELLSLIPGSDVLGITNEADTTSGQELVKGWTGRDFSEGNWLERNLAGPAVEMALDPSMYLGGIGALTKAGQAATKAGTLTRGLIPGIRAGEKSFHPVVGALNAIGVPGLEGAALADKLQAVKNVGGAAAGMANLGVRSIPKVGPLAGAGIDLASLGAEKAKLIGRSLFDVKAGRVARASMQKANEFAYEPAREAGLKAARDAYFNLQQQIDPLYKAGVPMEDVWRVGTQMAEDIDPRFRQALPPSMTPAQLPALHAASGEIRKLLDPLPAEESALGISSPTWAGAYDLDYLLARINRPGSKGAAIKGAQPYSPFNPSQLPRKPIFDLPGGRVQAEDFIANPLLSGSGRTAAIRAATGQPQLTARQATTAVRDRILAEHMSVPQMATTGTFPLDFPEVAREKATGLARYLGKIKDEHINIPGRAEPRVPFFDQDIVGNTFERLRRSAESKAKAQAVHAVIGDEAKRGMPGIPATTTLFKAGQRGRGAYESGLRAVGEDPMQVLANAYAAAKPGQAVDEDKVLRQALSGFALPEREAAAVVKYMNPWKAPEEWAPVVGALDWLNSKFRDLTYSAWPASWGRNAISGVGENAWEGTMPWSPAYRDIQATHRGLGIDTGLPQYAGLSPQEQRIALQREMFVHQIGGRNQGQAGAVTPGAVPFNPTDPRPTIPSLMKGFPKAPIETGKQVNQAVEDVLRQSEYLDLRRKGYVPAAAADTVMWNHFDYTRGTPFEKNVLKRLMPFPTFPLRNLPKQVGRALTSPGKISGPIRLSGVGAADQEGYVPEYLQSGLALPLGTKEDGTTAYLSQLGLPMEEAFGRLKIGTSPFDTAVKTGQAMMGMLRPEIKGPLEALSGKQFFTGREMADLHVGKVESAGGLLDEEKARVLAQALLNSPATRMVSTLNRLMDERKYTPAGIAGLDLGLGTGAKITDVDTEKWKATDARHNLEELMRGSPGIRQSTDFYPTREAKAAGTLTPQQEYDLRLYATMKARAREAAEKKRIGIQLGGG